MKRSTTIFCQCVKCRVFFVYIFSVFCLFRSFYITSDPEEYFSLPSQDSQSFFPDDIQLLGNTNFCVNLFFESPLTVGIWSDSNFDICATHTQYEFIMSMSAGNFGSPAAVKLQPPDFEVPVSSPVSQTPFSFALVLDIAQLSAVFYRGVNHGPDDKICKVLAKQVIFNLSMQLNMLAIEFICQNLVFRDERTCFDTLHRDIVGQKQVNHFATSLN
jgi:hypothetical protein